ncbi:leucine-rich repeat flightless-interacting protein 2 isoform X1 [Sabethes cyaneus]|uniref:leucine-rich repeat flightless-interacting protein 2 isoform X1 n=1 Tax=Sabethes cyaneus TaxID=53552 RepID=UPI00237D82AF|nr:leucine-rich repeat flightless-interacting protein 2 isoform X1 [Sabethes cyaneus]XP_053698139.1 leucine-rich repeat flightless-interacting protein 2 isoform X1 [Sabethes cyaneus]XP_053698140.1 leucine-rich repeat flightless-interacting protein 2 isoform X1 [Sabethes cyaneus]XP_053698141.1 leucine-rich repeat flightless-interacting protein 2 isoform X1 [Sabethes cyaneus]XP_053698142.1 leucine-rich repeat flightless-interacting protein 2 isoform X1 [Sabethes cyaneus]XP_053698143.1 leucine-ri
MSSDIKLSISEDGYRTHGTGQKFSLASDEDDDEQGEFYSFEEPNDPDPLTAELKIRESNEDLNVDINRNDLVGKEGGNRELHEAVNEDSDLMLEISNGFSDGVFDDSDLLIDDHRLGEPVGIKEQDEIDRSYDSYADSQKSDQDHHPFEPHRQYHRLSVCHTGDEFSSDEDEAFVELLEKANHIAEARLAARRQARAEAREIRMRELERQQKELEQNADRVFDLQQQSAGLSTPDSSLGSRSARLAAGSPAVRGSSLSSRRSSEDSLEEEGRSLRDLRHELKDVEERFRKAMVANAQLDNERASQSYQIQLLKDKLEEMEESHAQLQREYKEKCRDHDALKRANDKLSEELKLTQGQLQERDTLIEEQGMVIVTVENEDGSDARRALVTVENAQLLGSVQGSLDVRLKKFSEEKHELQNEVQTLQQQLKDVKTKGRKYGSINGALDDDDYEDAQREANKLITDYKYKLQKAEQEIANLQASLARSETQVIRYRSTAEAAEKAESDLKIERRKLQRENREAMDRLEELETCNNHLLKRLDKLKNAKSALLKDL